MLRLGRLFAVLLFGSFVAAAPFAADKAEDPLQAFLRDAFPNSPAEAHVLWLSSEARSAFETALGHASTLVRVRYWQVGSKTAWILDEVGKEQPITTGIVVDAGKVVQVRVLRYRESRGGEVQRPAFLRQFEGAALKTDGRLDRRIDGITGATLSVNALQSQTRAALALDRWVREAEQKRVGVS